VYGPWGRPDMALFKFTKLILNGDPIKLNNHGEMARDFTYIDDIIEGIIRVQDKIPQTKVVEEGDPSQSSLAPYRIFNIGKGKPQNLKDFVSILENCLDVKAKIEYRGMQPGDVITTHADTTKLFKYIGYSPQIPIEEGIERFVDWYREYYS
jgi:UDP-glucuronate 4-epimerase